ncbi:MAG TPA: hypothetical protein VHM30_17695 [Gemmatimonadaceae bacterium]|nr:hypothetical protein [Gemmatimonadaceae bacterium]
MADDIDRDDAATGAAAPPPRRRKRWGLRILTILVLVPILAISLWTAIALNWSYSRGDRSGYIQKFSKKGWLCKTWEGQLAIVNVPGSQPEIWEFTVRDESVAQQLRQVMGDRVTVSYQQHMGVPFSCFGDTQYYVDSVRPIVEPAQAPTAPMPPIGVPGSSPSTPPATPSTRP